LKLNPEVDFRFADLSGVDFGEVNVSGFDFTGADLENADMTQVRSISSAIGLSKAKTARTLFPIEQQRTREEIAALKAEILEELRKSQERPLDAEEAARVDQAVERILSSNDARLKPIEADLREQKYEVAYSRLMDLGRQSSAGASDLAADAFEHFSNAGVFYLDRDTAKAIEALEAARNARPDHFWTRVQLGRLYLRAGRTGESEVEARACSDFATTDRERSMALNQLGDVLMRQGRTDGALRAYEEGLKIARALLASDSGSAEVKPDLSVSLNKVGEVFLRQGRTDEALAAFDEALEVQRDLLASDPGSAEAKPGLSVSLNKVGEVCLRQGRTNEALATFEEALEVQRNLLGSDPGSAVAKRDVSVSLEKVGDVLVRQGRTDEALAAFDEALAVQRDLLASDPGSAEAKRDVVVSLAKLGELSGEDGQPYWHEAHTLVKELHDTGRLDPVDAWLLDDTAQKAGLNTSE
jgi:tetratricopeptide (TPR) repeat protein